MPTCNRCDGEGVVSSPNGWKLVDLKGAPPSYDEWDRMPCPDCGGKSKTKPVATITPPAAPSEEKPVKKTKKRFRRI